MVVQYRMQIGVVDVAAEEWNDGPILATDVGGGAADTGSGLRGDAGVHESSGQLFIRRGGEHGIAFEFVLGLTK
jgi:hypothetical protein